MMSSSIFSAGGCKSSVSLLMWWLDIDLCPKYILSHFMLKNVYIYIYIYIYIYVCVYVYKENSCRESKQKADTLISRSGFVVFCYDFYTLMDS